MNKLNNFKMLTQHLQLWVVLHLKPTWVKRLSLCNLITCLLIALESCLNSQKMRQVLRVRNEKKICIFLGFRFYCEWCHKRGRFLAILAQVTWARTARWKYLAQVFIRN